MAPKDTSKLSEPASSTSRYETREFIDGSKRLPTGYEGNNIPDDFHIPACTIEDVDKAVFTLFDKDLKLTVTHRGAQKSVPVIFATGERFALVKRLKPIRDDQGALILPLISIRRSGMTQSKSRTGRGQDTGDLVLKKRLDSSDRRYQRIVNKMNLNNQDGVVSDDAITDLKDPKQNSEPGRLASRDYQKGPTSISLDSKLGSNIYEIITVPFPKFYGMTYEVTFWTQYTTHMNSLLEQTILAYQAPGNNFKITTDKGYWFVAYVDDELNDGTNFDDFTDQERIVRYTFTLSVDAYLVANQPEGAVSPFRRFISAPNIAFTLAQSSVSVAAGTKTQNPVGASDIDAFMLEDTEMLDRHGDDLHWRGRPEYIQDPFNSQRFLRVLSSDAQSGESTVSATIVSDLGSLDISGGGSSNAASANGPTPGGTLSSKSSSLVPGSKGGEG